MGQIVVSGAKLACPMGKPGVGSLTVLPTARVTAGGQPIATIQDIKPTVNVGSFGMCTSLQNPQVAAATSAALGTLTPQPCLPNIASPWSKGSSTVQVGGVAALTSDSTCQCAWGGKISVTQAGQATTTSG
jgi:hypothetical protein